MIPTIIQGVAMAFFFIPLSTITLSGLHARPHPRGLRPDATSCGSPPARSAPRSRPPLWENRAALHHAQLAESVNNGSTAAQQRDRGPLGAAGFSPSRRSADQPPGRPAGLHAGRDDIFYGSAVLFLLLIPLVWLAKPARRAPARRTRRRGRTSLLLAPRLRALRVASPTPCRGRRQRPGEAGSAAAQESWRLNHNHAAGRIAAREAWPVGEHRGTGFARPLVLPPVGGGERHEVREPGGEHPASRGYPGRQVLLRLQTMRSARLMVSAQTDRMNETFFEYEGERAR